MRKRVVFGFCLLLLSNLSGCSTVGFSDLFTNYASQLTPVRQAITNNQLNTAKQSLPTNSESHSNYLLNQLEHARVNDLNGDKNAQSQFESVYQQMQVKRQKAKIQLGSSLEQSNALLTNDSVIAYTPAPYEMSMLHSYKALNYVYQNDIEGALVEVRRANKVQTDALNENQGTIDDALKAAQQQYPDMGALMKDVKNGFQNAFTFYLSGLLYESSKQYDDAYIDYKKALEINPENSYLQQTILRLAKRQGFDDDYAQFEKRFGKLKNTVNGQGEVIVLVEQGLVPKKEEFTLRLPIFTSKGDARFYSVALPVYKNTPYAEKFDKIELAEQALPLKPLVHIEALAAKTLEEQTPARVSRQVLRLVAKEKVRAELARSGGDVGNILANLYNLASEQADTRSWLTLPNQISVARSFVSEGAHSLTLDAKHSVDFTVSKQGLTLIYLTSINNYFNSHVVQL